MSLGYDGKLYILAFDHRGSFQKKMFGIEGDPTPEETATISDAKHLIFEGMVKARRARRRRRRPRGALVDEQFGARRHPGRGQGARPEARDAGREVSGQDEFDFEYGDEFGDHIEKFDPDFSKVLVRYNPDGDAEHERAPARAASSASPTGSTSNDRKFLFELLVPATDEQLESVGGDTDRYDAELRPELMRRAIEEHPGLRHRGRHLEDRGRRRALGRRDARRSRPARGGRDGVVCVLLGRGASDEKVDHWLPQAAPVDGFVGFAIGRSIWWDPLKGFLDGSTRARRRGAPDRAKLPALHGRLRAA